MKSIEDFLRPTQCRIEGFEAGVKASAAIADKFAAECLASNPRAVSAYDMGIGAERVAKAIRDLLKS